MTGLLSPIPLGWVLWLVFFLLTTEFILVRTVTIRQKMLEFICAVATMTLGITPKAYVYVQSNDTISTIYSELDQTGVTYNILFLLGVSLVLITIVDLLLVLLVNREY